MSKFLFNFLALAMISILPTSYVYAKLPGSYVYTKVTLKQQKPKTAIISVTSIDPNNPYVKLDGSFLLLTYGKEADLTEVHTTTPWEMAVTEDYARFVLKTDLKNSLQVQVFERTDDGYLMRVSGTGHVFDGNLETKCDDNSGCFLNASLVAF